jgi:hypothetical protein
MIGSFTGGVTAMKQGKEQEKALEQERIQTQIATNQRLEDIQTMRNRKTAELERQIVTTKSTQKAQYGASGVTSEGSPMENMLYTEGLGREAVRQLNYDADVAISRTREAGATKAAQLRYAARLARKAGTMSYISGMFGGGASAASTYGSASGAGAWSFLSD